MLLELHVEGPICILVLEVEVLQAYSIEEYDTSSLPVRREVETQLALQKNTCENIP